jgi:hypothetical protein
MAQNPPNPNPTPTPNPSAATAAGDAARSHAAAGLEAVRPRRGPERHPVPEPGADPEPGAKPAGLRRRLLG